MPGFSFATVEPNQLGQVTKWDVPVNDWLGLKFGSGNADTFGNAISRRTEDDIWDDGNTVRPDVANRVYGIDGQLKFDQPVSIQRARLMHERKRKELDRQAYIESASHSWHSAKAVAGFGASLVGALSHPVDLGLAFLPFIGSEKAAAGVAKMGHAAWRQSLARGVFTEEALLAAKVPGGRLTAAVIDGVVNQAIVEIPVALQKHRDQANYTALDSAFNIIAGGVFSGAVKGLGLALERAGRLWNAADPRIKAAALFDTVNSILTGDSPKQHWAHGMDEATIREMVEEKVRLENPMADDIGQVPGAPNAAQLVAALPPIPEGHVRLFHGEGGPEGGGTGGAFYTASAEKAATFGPNVSWVDVPVEHAQTGFQKAREAGQGGDTFLLEAADTAAAKPLESQVQPATHNLDETTDQLRQRAIDSFLAKTKADHEAKVAGLVDEETKRVIDEVRRQSPPNDPEMVKRYTFKQTPDDSNIAAVNEDAAELQQSVLNLSRTDEQRIALEAEIKRDLKALEENGISAEKAVDAMIPCVTARAKT